MTGCDLERPYDMDGIYSVDLAGETHYFTKSRLICIPAYTMHCPLFRIYSVLLQIVRIYGSHYRNIHLFKVIILCHFKRFFKHL